MPRKRSAEPPAQTDYKAKVGDKVKVIANAFPYMEQYIGREGKVVGAITDHSCRVQLKGGLVRWFDYRELSLR